MFKYVFSALIRLNMVQIDCLGMCTVPLLGQIWTGRCLVCAQCTYLIACIDILQTSSTVALLSKEKH